MSEEELLLEEAYRMLASVTGPAIEDKKNQLEDAFSVRVARIKESTSMSRSEKRAALFKCRKNAEAEAARSASYLSRVYGVCVLPTDLITIFHISNISAENVTVHDDPVPVPELQHIAEGIPQNQLDEDLTIEQVSQATLLPTPVLHYVPVCFQPLLPISNEVYHLAINKYGPTLAKKCSFQSYFRLTMLQAYEHVRRFGVGVVRAPGAEKYLIDKNFPSVNEYFKTLRPVSITSQGSTKTLVPVCVDILHPAYHYRWPSTISKYLDGCLVPVDIASISSLATDVKKFMRFSATLAMMHRTKGNDSSLKLQGFSDALHEPSSGDPCVLSHLLAYQRRDISRSNRDYLSSNPLRHYGYFYDPSYGISFMTLSLPALLHCLGKSQLDNGDG